MEPLAWLTCPDPKLSDALAYLAHNPGKQLRSRLTLACAEPVSYTHLTLPTIRSV